MTVETVQEETTQNIDEINTQYDGQWLMVRVIKSDRYGLQEAAVMSYGADREEVAKLLPKAQDAQPRPSLAFFKAHAK